MSPPLSPPLSTSEMLAQINPATLSPNDQAGYARLVEQASRQEADKQQLQLSEDHSGRISRPLNCFMLYRQSRLPELSEHLPALEKSKIIGAWWHAEPEEVREHWRKLAAIAEKEHKKKHPDYQYKPTKKQDTQAGGNPASKTRKAVQATRSGASTSASTQKTQGNSAAYTNNAPVALPAGTSIHSAVLAARAAGSSVPQGSSPLKATPAAATGHYRVAVHSAYTPTPIVSGGSSLLLGGIGPDRTQRSHIARAQPPYPTPNSPPYTAPNSPPATVPNSPSATVPNSPSATAPNSPSATTSSPPASGVEAAYMALARLLAETDEQARERLGELVTKELEENERKEIERQKKEEEDRPLNVLRYEEQLVANNRALGLTRSTMCINTDEAERMNTVLWSQGSSLASLADPWVSASLPSFR